MQTKSDSDILFCLQLLSKNLLVRSIWAYAKWKIAWMCIYIGKMTAGGGLLIQAHLDPISAR